MNVGDKFGIYSVFIDPEAIHIKGFVIATFAGVVNGKIKVTHEGGETLLEPQVLQSANDMGDGMIVSIPSDPL